MPRSPKVPDCVEIVMADIERWTHTPEPHVEECPLGTWALFARLRDAVRRERDQRKAKRGGGGE